MITSFSMCPFSRYTYPKRRLYLSLFCRSNSILALSHLLQWSASLRSGLASVRCSYDCFTNRDFTGYPECLFATPYGFGALFFFQCGGVRSSEWCVKNSLTLLFKRTLTRPLMRHQTCEYKTNYFYVQHIQVKHTVL
jgi:hypothetical protein